MSDRRRPPSRRTSRVPSRGKPPARTSRVPPRRSGTGQPSSPPGVSWWWIILFVGGIILLVVVGFFGGRAWLEFKPATPTPTLTPIPSPTPSPIPTATNTPTLEPVPTPLPPDIPALQELAYALINEERRANGLSELDWDSTAAIAGLRHAHDMVRFGYTSHWNLEGQGPDYRYSLAGGLNAVRENIYVYEHSPGAGPATADEWTSLVQQAQRALMESPEHRANILSPVHTRVGVGIGYEASSGRLVITQEFVDRYLDLQPLPHQVSRGDEVIVAGRLDANAESPMLNLAHEPLPGPMSVADLNATSTYTSPAVIYETAAIEVDGEGRFEQNVLLNYEDQPGLYHVQIWVDTPSGQALTADVVVVVQ